MSHPTWVRGLKLTLYHTGVRASESHPTWVRGLKLRFVSRAVTALSRTLRGCVD